MRKNEKKQWLCIENWVYAVMLPKQLLLYNTQTGQYIISNDKQHLAIVAKMHEKKNLGVVPFECEWFDDQIISSFIDEAIEKNIFSLEDYKDNQLKPIRLMPVLNIQKDVERLKQESDRSIGETVLPYLTEISIFVTKNCSLGCSHCSQSCKQFMCCYANQDNSMLELDTLSRIAAQIKYAPILRLNFIGGDIFSYPFLNKIPEIFKAKKDKIHCWSHYKNFQTSDLPVTWDIIIDFPIEENILSECISANKNGTCHYHFIVQNEEEVNMVEAIVNRFDFQNIEIHPYFNGNNIDFFETHIFLNKEDILENTVTQRRIFCNQALNSNFFGSLMVFPNGDVSATVNTSILGNITTVSLLELITRELEQNTAWRETRNRQPCSVCLFQYLCPPLSNYEQILKKQNLCTLYANI